MLHCSSAVHLATLDGNKLEEGGLGGSALVCVSQKRKKRDYMNQKDALNVWLLGFVMDTPVAGKCLDLICSLLACCIH